MKQETQIADVQQITSKVNVSASTAQSSITILPPTQDFRAKPVTTISLIESQPRPITIISKIETHSKKSPKEIKSDPSAEYRRLYPCRIEYIQNPVSLPLAICMNGKVMIGKQTSLTAAKSFKNTDLKTILKLPNVTRNTPVPRQRISSTQCFDVGEHGFFASVSNSLPDEQVSVKSSPEIVRAVADHLFESEERGFYC